MPSAIIPRGFDLAIARAHLEKCDRKFAKWIARIGDIEQDYSRPFQPVDALARAILYQQLSGKAAATIVGRVEAHLPRGRRFSAAGIHTVTDEQFRAAGVSRNKCAALRDLAEKADAGIVPTAAGLARMSDLDIIEHLTQVRGIGRWTVEMMLMFRLGRPDILPIHDLGIRKGAEVVQTQEKSFKPLELGAFGERWAPHRTLASLYLWRIADLAQSDAKAALGGKESTNAKPVKRSQG